MLNFTDNQMHGKSIENMIKTADGIFIWSALDRKRSLNDVFDLRARITRS